MPLFHRLAAAALIALLDCTSAYSQSVSPPPILQFYESTHINMEDRLPDVFAIGYGAFWVPPPFRADSGDQSVGYDVYDRFDLGFPGRWTLYGTRSALQHLSREMDKAAVDLNLDIVWNHNGFSDQGTPGFIAAGGYPGFFIERPDDAPNRDGDFHGAFESGDIAGRISGLIDIDHALNHQAIRSPVPGFPNNITPGTVPAFGRLANTPDESNRQFYPDQQLTPILVFDPTTGESNIPIHPFNLQNPMAGDPVSENATGLLMRNTRWLVEVIGADGFRLDATKHMHTWVLNYYDRSVYRSNPRLHLDGSTRHVFGYCETFDGNRPYLNSFIRLDINPADPGRVGGNRDVLDFAQFFPLRDNLTGDGLLNDWRDVAYAGMDHFDDGIINGSRGVLFVSSHDKGGAVLNNVAYAYILMRPGNAVVYFNAKQFGDGRPFPADGRGDALGGLYGNAIRRLVEIRNSHGRGNYFERWIDKETLVFERDKSILVALNNRTDNGYDQRTVQVAFPVGTRLVELTGNAADATVDPNNDIPEVVTVFNDNGTPKVTIRVPRNRNANGVFHGNGYVIYGVATPAAPAGLVLSPTSGSIPAGTPTASTNGTTRLTNVPIVTGNTLNVTLTTTPVTLPDNSRDFDADGDNALLRLNAGTPFNSTPGIDFTTPGTVAYGFEQFDSKSPLFGGGSGVYTQTIDLTNLPEGFHYLEAIAFRRRADGGPAVYTRFTATFYLDRSDPVSEYTGFNPIVVGVNENRRVVVRNPDFTANNAHVLLNVPAAWTDAQILASLSGTTQTWRYDREQFARDVFGVRHGNHVITTVLFEPTGRYTIQRFPGQFVSSIVGAGLGDLDANGTYSSADLVNFETILLSNNTQFSPMADFNGDGLVTREDLDLYGLRLQQVNASATVQNNFKIIQRRRQGDYNGDDHIAAFDLARLLSNYNRTQAGLQGDLDGNSSVNAADLTIQLANHGRTLLP